MAHRYFTRDINGNFARLCGQDAQHLAKVLRAKKGQQVVLCNENGTDYCAIIEDILPEEIIFSITESHKSTAEASLQAFVFLGMAKGEKMDFAIQKLVELGAAHICPFYSQFTVVKEKNDEAKTQRFARIAKEAAKQSGRGVLPSVNTPLGFSAMLKKAAECKKALLFYEAGGISLQKALSGQEKSLAIITGAEGGFSGKELVQAKDAGFAIVGLGPRILRCETAPIAALSVAMALTGNLG